MLVRNNCTVFKNSAVSFRVWKTHPGVNIRAGHYRGQTIWLPVIFWAVVFKDNTPPHTVFDSFFTNSVSNGRIELPLWVGGVLNRASVHTHRPFQVKVKARRKNPKHSRFEPFGFYLGSDHERHWLMPSVSDGSRGKSHARTQCNLLLHRGCV